MKTDYNPENLYERHNPNPVTMKPSSRYPQSEPQELHFQKFLQASIFSVSLPTTELNLSYANSNTNSVRACVIIRSQVISNKWPYPVLILVIVVIIVSMTHCRNCDLSSSSSQIFRSVNQTSILATTSKQKNMP